MEFKLRKLSLIVSFMALLAGGSALLAQRAPANEKAPDTYRVNLDLSTGPVVVEVTRALAPNGADRFYNLVKAKYFDGARFFRWYRGSWCNLAWPEIRR
jgi:peptidyl-prolyl cis-trans isomerase A (cyclophilin A)